MAARTHEERDSFEDRFFENQEHRFERVEDKLDKNTAISQKALDQALLTNSRVTHVEQSVKQNLAEAHKISNKALTRANRVNRRLVDVEKILLPNKPPEKENLPRWWKDDKVIKVIIYTVSGIILALLGWKADIGGLLE